LGGFEVLRLLLDTHILIWWYSNDPALPSKYADLLNLAEQKGEIIHLSVMSLWEITKLTQKRRISANVSLDQWFEELEEDPGLRILPLSGRIILDSNRLGSDFPKDPMDQLIAATARCHELRLMTADDKIIKSGVVPIA
jgi:PIN domain nuclease of toxin-antitoxin system